MNQTKKDKIQQLQKQIADIRPTILLPNRPKFNAECRMFSEALTNAATAEAEDAILATFAERALILATCPRAGIAPAARPRRDGESAEEYLQDISQEDRHAR